MVTKVREHVIDWPTTKQHLDLECMRLRGLRSIQFRALLRKVLIAPSTAGPLTGHQTARTRL